MTTPDHPSDPEDLHQQIKLLVRTEHQLHRSQSALDRQLLRVELLSHFTLRWDSQAPATHILSDAASLFRRLFTVDRLVIAVGPGIELPAGEAAPAVIAPLPGDVMAAGLADVEAPLVVAPAALPDQVRPILDALGLALDAAKDAVVVVLPLRQAAGAVPHALIAISPLGARATHIREEPGPAAIPFLRLMGSHIEHLLRNSTLLAALASAQRRLLAAQSELEERVVERTAALTREVAERRRTEVSLMRAMAEAEQASVAKSAFLANMSHELRTPLNAIIGYSEMLQEDATLAGQSGCVADIGKIISAGRHLLALINDVLDLSKIEAGYMQLDVEPFDLTDLVRGVLTTSQPLIAARGNALHVEGLETAGRMRSDRTKVQQVLLNLVGNAAKFTERGQVRLTIAHEPGGIVRLEVADTGIGMSPEQIGRLFKEFTQADASTTRRYGGTGLGLAISQRLCHLMGGSIVATAVPGAGSTFTARLPAHLEMPVAAEEVLQ